MNLPAELRQPLQAAAGAVAAHLMREAEACVSQAAGRKVRISSGPTGQIVIAPEDTAGHPAHNFLGLALPVLLGSVALNLRGKR